MHDIMSVALLPLLLIFCGVAFSSAAPIPGLSPHLTFHDAFTHEDINTNIYNFTELDVAVLNQSTPLAKQLSDTAKIEVRLSDGLLWAKNAWAINASSGERVGACGFNIRRQTGDPGIKIIASSPPDADSPRLFNSLPWLFANRSFEFSPNASVLTITLSRDGVFDIVRPIQLQVELGRCIDSSSGTASQTTSVLFRVLINIQPTPRSNLSLSPLGARYVSLSGAAARATSLAIATTTVLYTVYSATDLFLPLAAFTAAQSKYPQSELCPVIYGGSGFCASVWVSPSQRSLSIFLRRVPDFFVGVSAKTADVIIRPEYFVAGTDEVGGSPDTLLFPVTVSPSPSDFAFLTVGFLLEFRETVIGRGRLAGGSPLFWFKVTGDAFSFTDQASKQQMQTALFEAILANMTCSLRSGFRWIREDPVDPLGFCGRARRLLHSPTLTDDKQQFHVYLREDPDFDVCVSERVQFELPESLLGASLVSGLLPEPLSKGRAIFDILPDMGVFTVEMVSSSSPSAANAFVNSGVQERWLWDTARRSVDFPGSTAAISPFTFKITLRGERWVTDARSAAIALARDGFKSAQGCTAEPLGWCRYATELFTGAQGGSSYALSSNKRELTVSLGIAASCNSAGCSDFFQIVSNETVNIAVPGSAVCAGTWPAPTVDTNFLAPLPLLRRFVITTEPAPTASYPPFVYASQIRASGARLIVAAEGDVFESANLANAQIVSSNLINIQTIAVTVYDPASFSSPSPPQQQQQASAVPSDERNGFRAMLPQLLATITASGVVLLDPKPAVDGAVLSGASPTIPVAKRNDFLPPCLKSDMLPPLDAICSFVNIQFDPVTTFWLTQPERVTLNMATSPLWMKSGKTPVGAASVVVIPDYPTVEAVLLLSTSSSTLSSSSSSSSSPLRLYNTFFTEMLKVPDLFPAPLVLSQFVATAAAAVAAVSLLPDYQFNAHLSAAANLSGLSFFRASFRIKLPQQPFAVTDPLAVLYDTAATAVFSTNTSLSKLWTAANVTFSFLSYSASSLSSSLAGVHAPLPSFVSEGPTAEQTAAAVRSIEERFFPKTPAPPPASDPNAARNRTLAIVFGIIGGLLLAVLLLWIAYALDKRFKCLGCADRLDEWQAERAVNKRIAEETRAARILEQEMLGERKELYNKKKKNNNKSSSGGNNNNNNKSKTVHGDDFVVDDEYDMMNSDDDTDEHEMQIRKTTNARKWNGADDEDNSSEQHDEDDGGEIASSPQPKKRSNSNKFNSATSPAESETTDAFGGVKIKPRKGLSLMATIVAEDIEKERQQAAAKRKLGEQEEDEEEEHEDEDEESLEEEVWVPKRWSGQASMMDAAAAAPARNVVVKRGKSPFVRAEQQQSTVSAPSAVAPPARKTRRKKAPAAKPLSPKSHSEPAVDVLAPTPAKAKASYSSNNNNNNDYVIDVDIDLPCNSFSADRRRGAPSEDPFLADFDAFVATASLSPPRADHNSLAVAGASRKKINDDNNRNKSSRPIIIISPQSSYSLDIVLDAAIMNPFAALRNSPPRQQSQHLQSHRLAPDAASADSDIEIEEDWKRRRPEQRQQGSVTAVQLKSVSAVTIDDIIAADPFLMSVDFSGPPANRSAPDQRSSTASSNSKNNADVDMVGEFIAADALADLVNAFVAYGSAQRAAAAPPPARNPLQEEIVGSATSSRTHQSMMPDHRRFDDLDDFLSPAPAAAAAAARMQEAQRQQQQQQPQQMTRRIVLKHPVDVSDPLDAFRYGNLLAVARSNSNGNHSNNGDNGTAVGYVIPSLTASAGQQRPASPLDDGASCAPTFAPSRRTQNNFGPARSSSPAGSIQSTRRNNGPDDHDDDFRLDAVRDSSDEDESVVKAQSRVVAVPLAIKKRVRAFDEQDSFYASVESFYEQQHREEEAMEKRRQLLLVQQVSVSPLQQQQQQYVGVYDDDAGHHHAPPSRSSPLYHDPDAFWL